MVRKLIIFVLLLINSAIGHAGTYYFSSSKGDDKRSLKEAQNPETPWETIQKLNSLLNIIRPGDSILFKNGDRFHGTINLAKSGTVRSPIYFGSYGTGKNPTLTGLLKITQWKSREENLFEAQIPELDSTLNIVTFNNKIYPLGRYPNQDEYDGGYLTIDSYKNGHIQSSNIKSFINYSGGEIVIRKNNWIIDRHQISTSTNNSIDYVGFEKEIAPIVGYGFFIQNHPSTLDQHREWYFDRNSKKLLIYYDGNPEDEDIKVATLPEVLIFQKAANYITFENINIQGSNKNLITLNGSSNIVFENCNLEYIGQNAVQAFSTRNVTISNSTIKNSLNGGLFYGWDDFGIIVKNNTFENIYNFAGMGKNGEMQSQAIYMSEKTTNALIEENKFIKSGYNAINFSGNDILIKNNLVDTFCFVKDDGAGIYTFTGPSKTSFSNRKIIGNIIINGIGAVAGTKPYGISDLPYVEGIYLDTYVTDVEINNNTIANIKSKGIFLNNSKNITIKNNRILNTGYSIYINDDFLEDISRNIIVEENQFLAVTNKQLHYYVKSKINNLTLLGNFSNNIFSRPINISKTIYENKPLSSGLIDLEDWQKKYGLDDNSTKGPIENLQITPTELKSMKMENSILFYYNDSIERKVINLLGTYVDLLGNSFLNKIEISPYSSIILLKTTKSQ